MRAGARAAIAALLVVVLGLLASRIELTSDLRRLLPAEGDLPRSIELLETFQVADTLLVEVDGTGASRAELIEAVDHLGQALQARDDVATVRYRLEVDDGVALQKAAAPHAAALIPQDAMAARLSPEGIQAILGAQLARLAGPGGAMFERALMADPLDLSGLALRQLRETGPFRVQPEAGHFLSPSGDRAVLFVRPTESSIGVSAESTFVGGLEALLAESPLPARYMGGHRVASETAGLMFQDVQRAGTLGVALLAVVFLVGFRSARPLVGAVGPVGLSALAILAAVALRSPVHSISLALVAPLLGLAVDYWIHLYVSAASRPTAPDFAGRLQQAQAAFTEIAPALGLSAASTVGACLVLTLSRYPVVRDLGFMGVAAAGAALLGAWLLGPVSFALIGGRGLGSGSPWRAPRWAATLTLAACALAVALAPRSSFEGDPRALTPVVPESQALEQELTDRYGGFGTGGMVILDGDTAGEALDKADAVREALADINGVIAMGPWTALPGPAVQAARRAALPSVDTLQARIDAAAEALGFAPGVFGGAAARALATADPLTDPDTWADTPLQELMGRHLRLEGARPTVMVALVLGDDSLAEMTELAVLGAVPGAELVMPRRFAARGVEEVLREMSRLGALALLGVAGLLLLRYREPRQVIAAFAPCLASLAWALGVLAGLGVAWNAISACAMLLIVGLSLDYGVFMVQGALGEYEGPSRYAVGLSALTTLAGFGILAVAQSPALYGIGFAVLGGMTGAAVTALTISPRIARGEPLAPPALARWSRRLAFVALALVNLDMVAQQAFFLTPPPPGELPPYTLDASNPADRRFGPNRLVQSEGITAMVLEGTPYQVGYAAAVLSEDLHARLEREMLASFEEHVPTAIGRFLIVRGTALLASNLDKTFRPEHLDEIRGAVDGVGDTFSLMGPAYTRKVYYHAIHDVGQAIVDTPFVLACTGFMAGGDSTADGHWIMGRNFDFDGGPVFDRDKVVTFVDPDEGIPFVSVTFTGMVGVVTGLNRDGLAVAIQAAGTDAPIQVGTPMTLIVREIVQHASSLDEAEAILRARKGFVSENVLVIDADAGEAAVFEVSPVHVVRRPVDGHMAVANHFHAEVFADDATNQQRMTENTTGRREARMAELLDAHAGRVDMARAVEILRDRAAVGGEPLPIGHRHAIDADIATHSVVIDATARTLWVSRYPNTAGGYVAFNLEDGLAGRLEPVEVVPSEDVQRTLRIHRGRALLKEARAADPEDAEAIARRALGLMPDHPEALQVLAEVLVALDRPDEAAPLIRQALATPPEYGDEVEALTALLAEVEGR
ncbi:MAG: hypothetical protein H6739_33420 [Alphaproteobacteria bacterium]|nr:hypothetical protein [Alphaproteobacteria bacterium]